MFRLPFPLVCCLLFVAACSTSGINITSDYRESVNYAALQSYAWYRGDDIARKRKLDPLTKEKIVASIDQVLEEKGFVIGEKPDFLVNFSVTAKTVYDIGSYYTYSGYTPGFNWTRNGYGLSSAGKIMTMEAIREGTLVVDILDADKQTIIWRGIATKRLPKRLLGKKERESLIDSAIKQVLDNFPSQKQQP